MAAIKTATMATKRQQNLCNALADKDDSSENAENKILIFTTCRISSRQNKQDMNDPLSYI